MNATPSRYCDSDITQIATAGKRYQKLELFADLVEYREESARFNFPKRHERVHLRTHCYDPKKHSIDDAEEWIRDAENRRPKEKDQLLRWFTVAILDGREFKLLDVWLLNSPKSTVAYYAFPATCQRCNRLFFNKSEWHRQSEDTEFSVYPRWRTFCSDDCRIKHNQQKQTQRRRESRVQVTKACDQCGHSFKPQRSTARYCSTKCRVAHHRQEASGSKSEPTQETTQ